MTGRRGTEGVNEVENVEEILKKLFDFQRFEQEEMLAALIRETEALYNTAGPVLLSDDWLEGVAAAGDPASSAGISPTEPYADNKFNKGDQNK